MCCHLVELWRVQIIHCKFFSFKKNRFAELSPPSQCGLQNLLCIKLSFSIKTKTKKKKNRVAVESDPYGFERALAFVSIHPWVNG